MKKASLTAVLLLLCLGAKAAPAVAPDTSRTGRSKSVVSGAKGRKIDGPLRAYYREGLEVVHRDPNADAAFKERLKNYTLETLRKLKGKE